MYHESGNIKVKCYYINGKLHREGGPAILYYDKDGNIESKEYWLNGNRHREDGPAEIYYYKDESIKHKKYYLNHEELTEQEWFDQTSIENKLRFSFGCDNG